jgi:exodeoxyribonuclease VII small subunit
LPCRGRVPKVAAVGKRGAMAEPDLPQDIAAMSFEAALAELEAIVKRLEVGNAKLDDAISAYERGALLKRHCEAKLREAQARVDKIVMGSDGTTSLENLTLD